MGLAAQPVPAEVPDSDEGGFEEKGHRGLNGEQRAEDVAHILRIARPVGAELEFKGDARDDAQGEINEEEAPPEFHLPFPEFVPGGGVARFHPDEDDGKAESERHKDEMEEDGHGELQP